MAEEGFSILTASGDTIGRTLTTAVYHLLANPEHVIRLREELASVMPNPMGDPELVQLENLPWLVRLHLVPIIRGENSLIHVRPPSLKSLCVFLR